tara:strand:- start:10935 stop:12737 length:1803 start_codon:yes stop_codon:yes gene_type:complete
MTNIEIEALLSNGYDNLKLNKFSEAIKFFEKAYKINNDYPKTLFLLGVANATLKNFEQAKKFLYKASTINPEDYFIQYNLAKVYSDLNRDEEAVKHHIKAIKINSNKYEAWLNYGVTNKKIGNYEQAIECFNQCIKLNPNSSECYTNLGDIYFEVKKYDEAIKCFNFSLSINKNNASVITKIGVIYKNLHQFDKALDFHNKAIKVDAKNPSIYSNIGITYRGLRKYNESIKFLNKALEIDNNFEPALINKAVALTDLNDFKLAESIYLKILKLNSTNVEAATNLGMLYLSNENFIDGWKYFEKRWDQKTFQEYIKTNKKYWDGINTEKKLLIVSEQGLGDQILFGSMINDLKKICKNIFLTCDPKLEKIFRNSFKEINIISRNDFNEKNPGDFFDIHIPLGNLGKYLRKNKQDFINTNNPYLIDNFEKTKIIKNNIKKNNSLLCGISWKSNNKEIGIDKSISLDSLKDIIQIKNIDFVNLQYGEVKKDLEEFNQKSKKTILEMDNVDVTNDIESLCSLIRNCDFVLTTSNTTAHLAGALNIPTLIIVPRGKGKFFYWTANKSSTLWYPSVKIFRQNEDFTWKSTIKEVEKYIIDNFKLIS